MTAKMWANFRKKLILYSYNTWIFISSKVRNTISGSLWLKKVTNFNRKEKYLASGHIESFSSTVDDVIDCLHRKIERHEFANGSKAGHGSTYRYACKSHLCDRRIHNAIFTVFFPQAFRNLQASITLRILESTFTDETLHIPTVLLWNQKIAQVEVTNHQDMVSPAIGDVEVFEVSNCSRKGVEG